MQRISEPSISELIAPTKPGKAIGVAGGVAVATGLGLATVLSTIGSISIWFLIGVGPLVGVSAWAITERVNDWVGLACAGFAAAVVPVLLYWGARAALVRALGSDTDVPLWVGLGDAWRLATTTWSPAWLPWVTWAGATVLGYAIGSGRAMQD